VPSGNRHRGWWRAPSETSWRHLAATLEALATAIDGADAEPTPDARAGVAKARPALDRVRQAAAAIESERAALDVRLVAAGQPPITPR
jgi:hypothetical protein